MAGRVHNDEFEWRAARLELRPELLFGGGKDAAPDIHGRRSVERRVELWKIEIEIECAVERRPIDDGRPAKSVSRAGAVGRWPRPTSSPPISVAHGPRSPALAAGGVSPAASIAAQSVVARRNRGPSVPSARRTTSA
jgi:hypothetical protein